jgi:hypothetical protein
MILSARFRPNVVTGGYSPTRITGMNGSTHQ